MFVTLLSPYLFPKLLCIKIFENNQGLCAYFQQEESGRRKGLWLGCLLFSSWAEEWREKARSGLGEMRAVKVSWRVTGPQEEGRGRGVPRKQQWVLGRWKMPLLLPDTTGQWVGRNAVNAVTPTAGSGLCLNSGRKTLLLQSGPESPSKRFPILLLAPVRGNKSSDDGLQCGSQGSALFSFRSLLFRGR